MDKENGQETGAMHQDCGLEQQETSAMLKQEMKEFSG